MLENIRKFIVESHIELINTYIFSHTDMCNWKSFRLDQKWKRDTGPAVRLWRAHLVLLLKDICEVGPVEDGTSIFHQVGHLCSPRV